jgi:hypothetical protein
MAGVPASITFSNSLNAQAKTAALLASANNALSHYPPSSWKCYSFVGSQASASSNIALGEIGASAVTAYIEDAGRHNLSVGHRRWLLYPQTRVMGAGDVAPKSYSGQTRSGQNASAIIVFDNQFGSTRPQTRDAFVNWPPAGFVPYQLVFPRWSFSLDNADFSQASVTVTLNNQRIPLQVFPVENGYGENTIVWEINESELKKPTTDLMYQVSIRNVLVNGSYRKNYNYQVKAFDPAKQGADSVLSTISGASQVNTGQSSQYSLSPIPGVGSYQVQRSQRVAYQHIATAENGLEQLKTNTTGVSNIISNFTSSSGQKSYFLSHKTGESQWFSLNRQFLVNADSSLEYYSRLNCAMPDEVARTQISLDDGASWQDIHTQIGIRFGLRESYFTAQSLNLSAFAGKIIRVRFNFTFKSGWRCSTANSGWYVDDINFNNVDELTNPQLTDITRTSFQFSPTKTTDYVLAIRGILFNGFTGQWGAGFTVQVTPKPPVVTPPSSQPPAVKPPASTERLTVVFKSTNGTSRSCEYTKANLSLNGTLRIALVDTACFNKP